MIGKRPKGGKIAVKVINHYGDEVLKAGKAFLQVRDGHGIVIVRTNFENNEHGFIGLKYTNGRKAALNGRENVV